MTDSMSVKGEAPTAGVATAAAHLDRHARGRERRRHRVYEAALALFLERGYEDTTMDDIAERADVARTSVFNYFSPKTAFLDEWGTRRRQQAFASVHSEHLEETSAAEVLRRYMAVLGDLNAEARDECVVMMGAALKWNNVMLGQLLAVELSAVLERGRLSRQIREEVDTEQAGLLLAVGYYATLATWIAVDPEPFDVRTQLAKLVDLVLNGLAPRAIPDSLG